MRYAWMRQQPSAKKMSVWCKGTLDAVNSVHWCLVLRILYEARKPLDHFYFSMIKKRPAHDPNNLARMVWGGADSIAADLLSMLDVSNRCWEPITDDIPALHLPSYHTFIVALILQQLGNFDRRFCMHHVTCIPCPVAPLQSPLCIESGNLLCFISSSKSRRIRKTMQSDPLQLLWLAKEPADIPCPKRKKLCNDILNSDERALHSTTLKLKVVFIDELRSCAGIGDGKLSMVIWAPLRLIAVKFTGTSQARREART